MHVGLRVAMVSLLAGCSLIVHDAPPTGARADRFHPCDEGYGWPIVDTLLAANFGVIAVTCAAGPCENESGAGAAGAAIGTGVLAAVFAYSAYRGFGGAGRCRDLHAEFAAGPAPPAAPSAGVEGADCRADGSCDAGLTCASGLCVRPPGGPGAR
jgi:hypothetical protein